MKSQINVALKKARLGQITAGILTNNFFETASQFKFLGIITGTPA